MLFCIVLRMEGIPGIWSFRGFCPEGQEHFSASEKEQPKFKARDTTESDKVSWGPSATLKSNHENRDKTAISLGQPEHRAKQNSRDTQNEEHSFQSFLWLICEGPRMQSKLDEGRAQGVSQGTGSER